VSSDVPKAGSSEFRWDDLLPEYPATSAEADADVVEKALVASYAGRRGRAAAS